MRFVITGGCGFIGINLIRSLLQRDASHSIVVLDNESLGKREHLAGLNAEFVHGDIRDKELVLQVVEGANAVVHLAADTRVMDSIVDPVKNFECNVIGTFNVLNAIRTHKVPQFVNASTGGAILGEVEPPVHEGMIPKPISPYGASKLAVEGYCSAYAGSYGLKATSLRFSNVYGPRSYHKGSVVAAFFKNVLKGEPLTVYGDGSQIRDYIYIDDICSGIINTLEQNASGVYQLGSGVPVTINQLIDHMRNVVGDQAEFTVVYKDFRAGEIRSTYCDITKASRGLNFIPVMNLEAGLRETWNWFRSVA